VQVDWIFVLRDHILKDKRLTYFRLPYVVLVSKFIEYFGVDVEDELEESTMILNHTSYLHLHKMGFTKVGNAWIKRRGRAHYWTNEHCPVQYAKGQ